MRSLNNLHQERSKSKDLWNNWFTVIVQATRLSLSGSQLVSKLRHVHYRHQIHSYCPSYEIVTVRFIFIVQTTTRALSSSGSQLLSQLRDYSRQVHSYCSSYAPITVGFTVSVQTTTRALLSSGSQLLSQLRQCISVNSWFFVVQT